MSNSYFSLKQFTIWQDKCAMKVGTDGVLLGAWVSIEGAKRILDVGTGTGLIALQLAQRCPEARITAIEIDREAALQAKENVLRSPWPDRVSVECCDFTDFTSTKKFDLIVSNPPYFVDALRCPDAQRNLARHSDGLNYEVLFGHSAPLLNKDGQISVIIPYEAEKLVADAAWKNGFSPIRHTDVYTKPGKPCRRKLLSFAMGMPKFGRDSLYIEDENGHYTPEYVALTKEFYIKL